jgi:hypothetical protein
MIKPDLKLAPPSPWENGSTPFWSPDLRMPWSPLPLSPVRLADLPGSWIEPCDFLSPKAMERHEFVIEIPNATNHRLPDPPSQPISGSQTNTHFQTPFSWQSIDHNSGFCKACRDELEYWFWEHIYNPYPTPMVVKAMAAKWRLTERQVRTFFTNHRSRYSRDLPQLKKQWAILAELKIQNTNYTKE